MGEPWNYLMFGTWGIGALLLLATLSTAVVVASPRVPERWRARAGLAVALGLSFILACAVRLASKASEAGSSDPAPSAQLAALAPRVAGAILGRAGDTTGAQGRYLVTWADALYRGQQGIGLVNELERRGIHAGATKEFGSMVLAHRVLDPAQATARIHLASGAWIDDARRARGNVQIAYSDPRSDTERREYQALRRSVSTTLRRMRRSDLVGMLDRDLQGACVPGVEPLACLAIRRMSELGAPAAVFLGPARAR